MCNIALLSLFKSLVNGMKRINRFLCSIFFWAGISGKYTQTSNARIRKMFCGQCLKHILRFERPVQELKNHEKKYCFQWQTVSTNQHVYQRGNYDVTYIHDKCNIQMHIMQSIDIITGSFPWVTQVPVKIDIINPHFLLP